MSDKRNNLEQRIKYLKLGGKICLDIVVLLMVVRTVIFMWFLKQNLSDLQGDSNQYDWTLIVTAIGWVILFLIFSYTQKKELNGRIPYGVVWWFEANKRWFDKNKRIKKQ